MILTTDAEKASDNPFMIKKKKKPLSKVGTAKDSLNLTRTSIKNLQLMLYLMVRN